MCVKIIITSCIFVIIFELYIYRFCTSDMHASNSSQNLFTWTIHTHFCFCSFGSKLCIFYVKFYRLIIVTSCRRSAATICPAPLLPLWAPKRLEPPSTPQRSSSLPTPNTFPRSPLQLPDVLRPR